MKCPVDNTQLVISDRQGVEIDYCPTCRGVWLDRGELDKLIERTATYQAPAPREEHPRQEYREQPREQRHYDDDDHRGHDGKRHHKKESFLGDIFDF